MKKVCLVLGSGGARGVSQIGVIEELERRGFTISRIAGCSMGALIGGIYCAGHLPTYKKWLVNLEKMDVFKLLDFTWSGAGFVRGDRVLNAIEELIGSHNIEEFSIPFTAVATDLNSQQEIYFKSGNLFKAIRASIAIPTVLTPVIDEGKVLLDGGLLNPLPIAVAQRQPDELLVAVNVNSSIQPLVLPSPTEQEILARKIGKSRWDTFVSSILRIDTRSNETSERIGMFGLLNRSFDLLQDRLTQVMLETYKPDILVNVSRNACGSFEFYRASELIEVGRLSFENAYAEYEKSSESGVLSQESKGS
ncbi:patatin-like phospholipase family protein [Solitalea canadensis]|uniref:Putative esterase of the alpha-beta hydrolase superfamily n=1 Tax=Solitalea canadensis (strain ATCC 29591 / DSM 3403 / JCM 21819 / LMG 8368 / NBRC 15130 / NCIMB 12057 / USAM 9D) TaxID=929556 RepID=H8KVH0_SOLCM|nr:patatin-like phospholipase family protein [Solitalea canadensis]AFD06350.1 putative esterase of the alpha-beta hydrolase superfamily [Solitalea canadensis DSM 3403]